MNYNNTPDSPDEYYNWFRAKIKNFGKDKPFYERQAQGEIYIGEMVMFHYRTPNPMSYDAFPLVVILDNKRGGFTGLNLHHLRPQRRMMLLHNLRNKSSDLDKITVNYSFLKKSNSAPGFKEAFRSYKFSNVSSHFEKIPATEWDLIAATPTKIIRRNT